MEYYAGKKFTLECSLNFKQMHASPGDWFQTSQSMVTRSALDVCAAAGSSSPAKCSFIF